jgi:hypothetical protein
VFSDNFESPEDWTANWIQDSRNDWLRTTAKSYEGSYAAEIDGPVVNAELISNDIDMEGKTNATITFCWFIERGLDRGEYLALDVSTGGGWIEAAVLMGNFHFENTWYYVELDLADINSLRIRFRGTMSRPREDAYLDMVEVIAH